MAKFPVAGFLDAVSDIHKTPKANEVSKSRLLKYRVTH